MLAWLLVPLKGLLKWLAPIFIQELIAHLKAWILEKKRQRDEAKQNKKAAEDYKAIVNDPTKTREERKNAEDDFINS